MGRIAISPLGFGESTTKHCVLTVQLSANDSSSVTGQVITIKNNDNLKTSTITYSGHQSKH